MYKHTHAHSWDSFFNQITLHTWLRLQLAEKLRSAKYKKLQAHSVAYMHATSFFPSQTQLCQNTQLHDPEKTSDALDSSEWIAVNHSDYWFGDLRGLGVQAQAALQLDPSEKIPLF